MSQDSGYPSKAVIFSSPN